MTKPDPSRERPDRSPEDLARHEHERDVVHDAPGHGGDPHEAPEEHPPQSAGHDPAERAAHRAHERIARERGRAPDQR